MIDTLDYCANICVLTKPRWRNWHTQQNENMRSGEEEKTKTPG